MTEPHEMVQIDPDHKRKLEGLASAGGNGRSATDIAHAAIDAY